MDWIGAKPEIPIVARVSGYVSVVSFSSWFFLFFSFASFSSFAVLKINQ